LAYRCWKQLSYFLPCLCPILTGLHNPFSTFLSLHWPQWDGGAPGSVSGHCPVRCILQPISKLLFLHKLWDPATNRSPIM
jgi:hypothetical protein